LLRVASRHFGAAPYDDVSMSAIAREADVSHGLAFHVFGSKQALFEAALTQAVADVSTVVERIRDGTVEDFISGLFTYVAQSEVTFRLALRAGFGPEEPLRGIVAEGRRRTARIILRKVGVPRPNRLALVAVVGWIGSLDATLLAWLDNRRVRQADLVAALAAALRETIRSCGYAVD
jgi:AcrR family transcriptional regulator